MFMLCVCFSVLNPIDPSLQIQAWAPTVLWIKEVYDSPNKNSHTQLYVSFMWHIS